MAGKVPGTDCRSARALLGVGPVATPEALAGAFRAAAMITHPDRPGGSADAFRAVVAAYRLLQSEPPRAPAAREATPCLHISPFVALRGGWATYRPPGQAALRLALPAGLRDGEVVRAGAFVARVMIEAAADAFVHGDDVWVVAPLDPALFDRGGRARVETPRGPRLVWVSRHAGPGRTVRLPGEGLPARGARPAGDLVLRLVPRAAPADTAACELRRRFAAAWAA